MVLFPALLFAAAATPQSAPTDPLNTDLRCVVTLSYAVPRASAAQRAALTSGMMYYVGKIEGRRPGYDLESRMIAMAKDEAALRANFATDIKRCVAELSTKGETLQRIGTALQALPPKK